MEELIQIIKRLRAADGCPRDRTQTADGIVKDLIGEVYELADAIVAQDIAGEREEIGDILFLLLFLSQIAAERAVFSLKDVVGDVAKKMRRRHPHIYEGVKVNSIEEVKANWDEIKRREKGDSSSAVPKGFFRNTTSFDAGTDEGTKNTKQSGNHWI